MGYSAYMFIAFIIIGAVDILVMLKNKPKKDEILVEVKTGSKGAELFNLIAAPFVALLSAWVFVIRLRKAIPILYPQYMDKWHQVFDHKLLESINQTLLKEKKFSQFLTVASFTDSGLLNLMISVAWIIIGCLHVFDYFQKKGIYEKGIYLGRLSSYKWDKACGYELRESYKKKDKEYTQLVIFARRNKINKWITGSETSEVKMIIDKEVYEKAEGILKDKIIDIRKEADL